MGSTFFVDINKKSESISFSGTSFSNSCKRNHGKILIVAEVIRRLVTDTLEKPELRYGHLCGFLWAKLEILGSTDFLFGLPINLIVNVGQNKFEVDILKNLAKIANLRPKIGQIPLLSLDIIGHNSIIFYPILTCFILNCLFLGDESNGVQIKALSLWCLAPIFVSEASYG